MVDRHLEAVYRAGSALEVAQTYDAWADTYEDDMARLGYRHPAVCLALLTRHLPKGSTPILDAGCGTGLVGEWLNVVGYPQPEGLDVSEGMLGVARAKGVYRRLHHVAMGGRLPFDDGQFSAAVCVGVFTTGHVGPEGLDELVRIVGHGGVVVLTVKERIWASGFEAHVEVLGARGSVRIVDQTQPYVSMPGDPQTQPSRAVVLEVG
jgi:SAM-dependent methyltransferase